VLPLRKTLTGTNPVTHETHPVTHETHPMTHETHPVTRLLIGLGSYAVCMHQNLLFLYPRRGNHWSGQALPIVSSAAMHMLHS